MAATVTRGTTFTLGQQNVDVATFKPLLTSATLTNIDRDNVDFTDSTPATMSATELSSPQNLELWQDSVTHFIMVYLSSAWAPALSLGRSYTLSSTSGSVVPGNILSPSDSLSDSPSQRMLKCLAGGSYRHWGVAANDVSPGGDGIMITNGIAQVTSTGTINAGEAVILSSTAGIVQSLGAAGTGYGPQVIGVALAAASGGYVWVTLRR